MSSSDTFGNISNVSVVSDVCPVREDISFSVIVSMTIFGIAVGLCSIIGNALIILVFILYRSIQKPGNILLTNLAVGDLMLSLVGFPFFVIPEYFYSLFCNAIFAFIRRYVVLFLIMMNLNNIAVIAVERVIGIKFPFFYDLHMTMKRIYCLAISSWVFGIVRGTLLCVLIEMSYNRFPYVVPEALILTFLLVFSTCAYIYLYLVSRRHLRRDKKHGIKLQESKVQAAVTIAIINGIFWSPVIIVRGLFVFRIDIPFLKEIRFFSPFFGSCLNVVIYTYRLSDYRYAVKKVFNRMFSSNCCN